MKSFGKVYLFEIAILSSRVFQQNNSGLQIMDSMRWRVFLFFVRFEIQKEFSRQVF